MQHASNSVNSTTGSVVALTPEEPLSTESYSHQQHFDQAHNGGGSINKSSSFIFDNHQRNLMKPTSKLIHSYSTSAIVKNPHSNSNHSSLSQVAADTTTSSIMEFPELGKIRLL